MIPLSIPHLAGNEWKYVKDCLDTTWVSMAGSYVDQFEEIIANYSGTKYGIAASNGTCGLHAALHVLGITRGDYVIVPNITFVASANAVAHTGADSIFVDVDPKTWQLDVDLLEIFLDNDTLPSELGPILKSDGRHIKAIMPVHVLGNIGDMEALLRVCNKHHLKIIEDATEALGAYYKGQHAGSFGDIGVFSFNGNKIITTGGGGMIVTNNNKLAKHAKHITTQAKANPTTYVHDEIGFNYRMVNILAAMGVAQMEQLDGFIKKRKFIDNFYRNNLKGIGDIEFQKVKEEVDPNCWLFTFKSSRQQDILKALKTVGAVARPFWTPMNQLPMFQENLYINNRDNSKYIHASCLSIPSAVCLEQYQLETVVNSIKTVFSSKPHYIK